MAVSQKTKDSITTGIETVLATACGAVVMLFYANQFLYPRTEGEKLEKRVDTVELRQKEDISEIKEMLKDLSKSYVDLAVLIARDNINGRRPSSGSGR
mgnify:CR=1 FL=1